MWCYDYGVRIQISSSTMYSQIKWQIQTCWLISLKNKNRNGGWSIISRRQDLWERNACSNTVRFVPSFSSYDCLILHAYICWGFIGLDSMYRFRTCLNQLNFHYNIIAWVGLNKKIRVCWWFFQKIFSILNVIANLFSLIAAIFFFSILITILQN